MADDLSPSNSPSTSTEITLSPRREIVPVNQENAEAKPETSKETGIVLAAPRNVVVATPSATDAAPVSPSETGLVHVPKKVVAINAATTGEAGVQAAATEVAKTEGPNTEIVHVPTNKIVAINASSVTPSKDAAQDPGTAITPYAGLPAAIVKFDPDSAFAQRQEAFQRDISRYTLADSSDEPTPAVRFFPGDQTTDRRQTKTSDPQSQDPTASSSQPPLTPVAVMPSRKAPDPEVLSPERKSDKQKEPVTIDGHKDTDNGIFRDVSPTKDENAEQQKEKNKLEKLHAAHLHWLMESFGLSYHNHQSRVTHKADSVLLALLSGHDVKVTENGVSHTGKDTPQSFFKGSTLLAAHMLGGQVTARGDKSFQREALIHALAYNASGAGPLIHMKTAHTFSKRELKVIHHLAETKASIYVRSEGPREHMIRVHKEEAELKHARENIATNGAPAPQPTREAHPIFKKSPLSPAA